MFKRGQNDPDVLYREWREVILRSYGYRSLSKASDKLPAVSGVAEAFRLKLNDEYLAGLWRKDLIRGILWLNSRNLWYCCLPPEYRAPSWSWASVDCGVAFNDFMIKEICVEVLDVCCKLVGKELTGEVTGGWMTISGPLSKAWVILPPKGCTVSFQMPLCVSRDRVKLDDYFCADCTLGLGSGKADDGALEETVVRSDAQFWSTHWNWEEEIKDWDSNLSSYPAKNRGECVGVWCLKIVEEMVDDVTMDCILILGRSQKQNGKFERLGVAQILNEQSRAILSENATHTTITII